MKGTGQRGSADRQRSPGSYSDRPVALARRAKAAELVTRLVAEGRVVVAEPDDDEVAEWRRVMKRNPDLGKQKIHYADPGGIRMLDFTDASGYVAITGVDRIAGDRAFSVTAWAYDWDGILEIAVFVGGPDGALVRSHVAPGLGGGSSTVTTVHPDGR